MGHDIRTRWHDLDAAIEAGHILINNNQGGLVTSIKRPDFDPSVLTSLRAVAPHLPNYFIDPSCLDLLKSDECTRSLWALLKMGRTELPHDLCIVEFSDPVRMRGDDARYFVLVSRRESPLNRSEYVYHPYQCNVFMLYRPNYETPQFREKLALVKSGRAIVPWRGEKPPEAWAVVPQTSVMLALVPEGFTDHQGVPADDGMHFGLIPSPWVDGKRVSPENGNGLDQEMMAAAHIAVRALLMLLRVRGVEQTTVSAGRLNKAREKRRQSRIPDHIVVNIGHFFNRAGERVRYDPTKPGHRFQRPHMRSGHYKRVWVGSGENRRPEERFIEPYLVNFTEGDEVPTVKRKILKGPGDFARSNPMGAAL